MFAGVLGTFLLPDVSNIKQHSEVEYYFTVGDQMQDWISHYSIFVLLNTPYSFEYNLNLVSIILGMSKKRWHEMEYV